jgi:hypothetical protein
LLPEWYGVQKDARDERLQRFSERRPDARREGADGYLYWREIDAELGISDSAARNHWRRLGLPEVASREGRTDREARTQRERLSRVLRTEKCIVCRQPFPWTVFRERERRLRGKRSVCSRSCAQTLRFHPEIAERRRRTR